MEKDDLDVEEFSSWVSAVAKSPDEDLRFEFCESVDFGLFIKGRFNVWTFDVEDPLYPDHDNYFLTEDNLLLFEFDETATLLMKQNNLLEISIQSLG